MLEVLQRRELDHVVAVIARYFGGTKLGAGGLVRAYSGTLAKTLDLAGVVEVRLRARLVIGLSFGDMDVAHRFLGSWLGLKKGSVDYDALGLRLEVELFEADLEAVKAELVRLSRGAVRFLNETLILQRDFTPTTFPDELNASFDGIDAPPHDAPGSS